jgi:hypothetical protein
VFQSRGDEIEAWPETMRARVQVEQAPAAWDSCSEGVQAAVGEAERAAATVTVYAPPSRRTCSIRPRFASTSIPVSSAAPDTADQAKRRLLRSDIRAATTSRRGSDSALSPNWVAGQHRAGGIHPTFRLPLRPGPMLSQLVDGGEGGSPIQTSSNYENAFLA